MAVNVPSASDFQEIILNYYNHNVRQFPWRDTQDPYKILVSEIMLQQTQTERVIKKYAQWLSVYPSVKEAAESPLSDILLNWNGLGYNRRAKFLHEACKKVYYECNSVFPSNSQDLKKLPGVGDYTSCAVSCFAFNNPEVFIETNIRSVFIFFYFPDDQQVSDKQIFPLIEKTLYKDNPRNWYYALMDYGAELKKKIKNPGRQSAHYSKQTKFEGSIRQARGALLRQLVQNKNGMELNTVQDIECIDYSRLEEAAVKLVSEGYIQKSGDLYCIKT